MITPFLLMGAMSPVSVPATLAQQMAEALAGIALTQLLRPGCPVVFGSFLSNTDMQSGSPSFGTPESAVGLLCTGQIARSFGLPWRSGGRLTASQTVDAQAAYEAMMTMLPTMLAGAVSSCTPQAGSSRGSSPVTRSHRRRRDPPHAARGVHAARAGGDAAFARTTRCATAAISSAPRTRSSFRECFYRPLLSSTENYERWNRKGGSDAAARASEIWKKTLEEYEQPSMDDGLREQLEEYVTRRRTELGD